MQSPNGKESPAARVSISRDINSAFAQQHQKRRKRRKFSGVGGVRERERERAERNWKDLSLVRMLWQLDRDRLQTVAGKILAHKLQRTFFSVLASFLALWKKSPLEEDDGCFEDDDDNGNDNDGTCGIKNELLSGWGFVTKDRPTIVPKTDLRESNHWTGQCGSSWKVDP